MDPATIYNQIHPTETPDLISKSQAALHEEIEKLSPENKAGWLQAKAKCPHLVGDDHTLMFLRCELFNAGPAASRLSKYWNKRIEIFGPHDAFQPLLLTSTMGPKIIKGLSVQLMRLTRTTDSGSRSLLYGEPKRLANAYDKSSNEDRLDIARGVWYLFHSALEEVEVQKKGMVFLFNYNGADISVVDPKLLRLVAGSVTGCLPVRVGGIHVCNPPSFFEKVVYPIIKLFMSERMRRRIHLHHDSSKDGFLKDLNEKYGLSEEVLPSELGGRITLDGMGWIEERKGMEIDRCAVEEEA